MINIDKFNIKYEIGDFFGDFESENSKFNEIKPKFIQEVFIIEKKCKIHFEFFLDVLKTFEQSNEDIFSYKLKINRKEIFIKFYYEDNYTNKSRVEKIKDFFNKYKKKKITITQKIINI